MTRPEWWEVTTQEDLDAEARNLHSLGLAFEAEARRWTHPARRADCQFMAEKCRDLAAWAHHVATTQDDPWLWRDVLGEVKQFCGAALLSLAQTERRREYEQAHTERPTPTRTH